MNKFNFIAAILFSGLGVNAEAQQVAGDTTKPIKSIFVNTGLQYISNLTYAGRKDDSSVPILLPTVTFISKQGFFLSGISYFDLSGSKASTEGVSVTPGYVFSLDDAKKFGGAVSATQYFITAKSPIILSSFKTTFDGQLSYNPGIAKLTLGGSYRLGKSNKNDFVNTAELSKEISVYKPEVNKKDGLKITPTINAYAGTQSFTETYYTDSQVQRAVDNPSPSNPLNVLFPNQPNQQTIVNQTVTEEKQRQVNKYNLLSVTGSVPVTYAINKFQINFTPYFIKPFNQVNYVNNAPMNGLYFMFTTGISATF